MPFTPVEEPDLHRRGDFDFSFTLEVLGFCGLGEILGFDLISGEELDLRRNGEVFVFISGEELDLCHLGGVIDFSSRPKEPDPSCLVGVLDFCFLRLGGVFDFSFNPGEDSEHTRLGGVFEFTLLNGEDLE